MKTQTTTSYNTSNNSRILSVPAKIVYDKKFKNNGEATIAGVFFLAVPILFTLFCALTNVKWDGLEVYITLMVTGACVLRAVSTLWIAGLAKERNRNHVQWMIIAFFVPGIALILMGQKKKIKDVNEYRQYLYKPKPANALFPSTNTLQVGQTYQMAS